MFSFTCFCFVYFFGYYGRDTGGRGRVTIRGFHNGRREKKTAYTGMNGTGERLLISWFVLSRENGAGFSRCFDLSGVTLPNVFHVVMCNLFCFFARILFTWTCIVWICDFLFFSTSSGRRVWFLSLFTVELYTISVWARENTVGFDSRGLKARCIVKLDPCPERTRQTTPSRKPE